MRETLVNWLPHVMERLPDLWEALADTLLMVLWSGAVSFLLGMLLGVLLTVTKPGNILENRPLYQIVDKAVSLFRSIPFIILILFLIPYTRLIMGTASGTRGVIFPLVISAAPFIARMVESSFNELDTGVIESAWAMGATNFQIIWKVLLPEAKPSSTPTTVKEDKISKNKIGELEQVLKNKGIQPEVIHVLYRVNSLEELSEAKYQNIMNHLKEIKERQDMQRT